MSEWTRLTPSSTRAILDICIIHESGYTLAYAKAKSEILEPWDGRRYHLTDAELDALIHLSGRWRQVPEVKALVTEAKMLEVHLCVECARAGTCCPNVCEKIKKWQAVLASFEET